MFLALFVALAGGGIYYGVRSSGVTPSDLGELWTLPIGVLLGLLALCGGLYLVDMCRYRVFGRAVGDVVTWRAALDATVANFFFSWITPGAALGAPAAIVMLGRRGVSWEGAALIAFGKSITGTTLLVLLAFAALATGYGPKLDGGALAVFTTGTGILAAMLLVLVAGAMWSEATIRRIDRMEPWLARRRMLRGERAQRIVKKLCEGMRSTVRRLAKLRTGGPAMPFAILGVHLAYNAVLVAIAVVLALAFGATSVPDAIGISIVYTAFTYVAPTPGGAGLSEAAATVFYGSILPARDAVLVVLLFRALTFYLHIVIGIVYLGIVGGTRQILERSKRPSEPAQ